MYKSGLLLFFIFLISEIGTAQVVINEIMSSNGNTIEDEDGDTSDWIELYNSEDESVNLEGYSLSDDASRLSRWQFPQVEIGPGEYLLVFASDKDRSDPLHTNFRISADGEELILSDRSGNTVDRIPPTPLLPDVSYGRLPEDSESFGFFFDPTPGKANDTESFQSIIDQAPTFENEPGYFSGTEIITINQLPDFEVRYTVDASTPSLSSRVYSEPFEIDDSRVIKASYFKDGSPAGPVATLSMINESSVTARNLPIVSVSANREELFSESRGLFLSDPGEREQQVYIELFEPDGSLGFGANAGMRIFGNESEEGFDFQQSLAFFARARYGDGSFNYRLFKEKDIQSFEAFILRNNNSVYDLYDGVANGLLQDILAVQAYQPVVLFINGKYWGVLNMMEKINEHYLESNFPVDSDSVDLLNGVETSAPFYNRNWVVTGDIEHYEKMIDFMRENDLSDDANFEIVESMMDVDNFATYQNALIFISNQDWPGNNMRWWRPQTEDGRWKWIFFDGDASLGAWEDHTDNTLLTATEPEGPDGGEDTWPNPPWSTFILRKLLENEKFENLFIATMCDLMATNFDPESSVDWVDVRENPVIPEMPNHLERWDFDFDVDDWLEDNDRIRDFLRRRPAAVQEHFTEFFDLGEMRELQLDVPTGGGLVKVNNRIVTKSSWSGEYFENLELQLEAIPDIGFEFDGWEGLNSESENTTLLIEDDVTVIARFRRKSSFEQVVISEISFSNSPEGDWVELYNPMEEDINVGQWSLSDNGSSPFQFPEGTVIGPGQYLIVCQNIENFRTEYEFTNTIGEFEFGLNGRGDAVSLRNQLNELVDFVEYKVAYPWPENASAISLIDFQSDNALPFNWKKSDVTKSPGGETRIITSVEEIQEESIVLGNPYPNPFIEKQTIPFQNSKTQRVTIKLLDITGKIIQTLVDEELTPGSYTTEIYPRNQGSGLFLIAIETPDSMLTRKVFINSKN